MVTGADGTYSFANVSIDAHHIREVPQANFTETAPASSVYNVSIVPGVNATGLNFANGPVTPAIVPLKLGDLTRDGVLNAADIDAMMLALTNRSAYEAQFNVSDADFPKLADINGDGSIDNLDLQPLLFLASGTSNGNSVSEKLGALANKPASNASTSISAVSSTAATLSFTNADQSATLATTSALSNSNTAAHSTTSTSVASALELPELHRSIAQNRSTMPSPMVSALREWIVDELVRSNSLFSRHARHATTENSSAENDRFI
jgi:hypothetical protein